MKRIMISVLLLLAGGSMIFVLNRDHKGSDEAWLAERYLIKMTTALIRYYELADNMERRSLGNVRNLVDLWSLVHKKVDGMEPLVSSPVDKGFLVDPWGRPYRLQITTRKNYTSVRIASDGPRDDSDKGRFYVELSFSPTTIREKHGWEPVDFESPLVPAPNRQFKVIR
jgi:hypothetical protein